MFYSFNYYEIKEYMVDVEASSKEEALEKIKNGYGAKHIILRSRSEPQLTDSFDELDLYSPEFLNKVISSSDTSKPVDPPEEVSKIVRHHT
jgi:hypothetical protein